ILDFYEGEDWNNYTIKVHALKSSSRLIGAMDLGKEAESLEMAGKASDIDYIKANNDRVMDMYDSVVDIISSVCGGEEEPAEDLPVAEDFVMDSFFDMIKEAAESFDYDGIENAFGELEGYAIPEKDKEIFDRVRAGFDIINYEDILAAIEDRAK
ncbi:MAG: Hpt domain-containing protein, partial [Lachnospiraceae bacterium]|nr:Hpt domain-containing protein [Lachnospiraceae bacterium]